MARPRTHDRQTIMTQLCERVSNGELVRHVAKDLGVDPATIRKWANENEAFGALYARAREDQAHAIAEQAIALADDAVGGKDGNVDKVRLQVDTRKWLASKIAPRLYGERVTTEVTGEVKHEHRGSITWGTTEVPL